MQGVVDGVQGGVEVGFPGEDGVSSGWCGFGGVKDSPNVVTNVDNYEVVREVEDAKHGDIKGSQTVAGLVEVGVRSEPTRWWVSSFE